MIQQHTQWKICSGTGACLDSIHSVLTSDSYTSPLHQLGQHAYSGLLHLGFWRVEHQSCVLKDWGHSKDEPGEGGEVRNAEEGGEGEKQHHHCHSVQRPAHSQHHGPATGKQSPLHTRQQGDGACVQLQESQLTALKDQPSTKIVANKSTTAAIS